MPFAPCWIPADELWQAAALLARWFSFQPSEIDALEVDELARWLSEASRQIKAESGGE